MGQILSKLVETHSATWRLPPLAAVIVSTSASLFQTRKRRLSFDENRRIKNGMKRGLPAAVFFFTATAGRQK